MYRVLLPVDESANRAELAASAVEALPGAADDVEVVVLNVYEEFEATAEGKVKSEEIWDEGTSPRASRRSRTGWRPRGSPSRSAGNTAIPPRRSSPSRTTSTPTAS
ncbi:hypothetical protein [Haloarcula litorea]|uniref:hypothetical protein n=1 Tax=Haloarcula litorea TaxID=3032579 RepID=UPI0030105E89